MSARICARNRFASVLSSLTWVVAPDDPAPLSKQRGIFRVSLPGEPVSSAN